MTERVVGTEMGDGAGPLPWTLNPPGSYVRSSGQGTRPSGDQEPVPAVRHWVGASSCTSREMQKVLPAHQCQVQHQVRATGGARHPFRSSALAAGLQQTLSRVGLGMDLGPKRDLVAESHLLSHLLGLGPGRCQGEQRAGKEGPRLASASSLSQTITW